ncbi:hypothetical protein RND71_022304 [Anisodus tanguticus]|uniref:Wax synthase domain-containing protein n=1 Tax=Anisodus tanguticus TaxID=243964 RepID=A0AAE1RYP4_9SOLA|nr:hypothetical protein RND71_022304 [Anisodus tanguticus]
MVSTMVLVASRVELEPPFDEPYKTSSLQDFWRRRWNLMVTNILRPTVYDPVRIFVELVYAADIENLFQTQQT